MDIVYQVHAVFGERILPLLVILLVWWIYGIAMLSGVAERYLRFPFMLYPLLGLIAVVVARVSIRPHGFFSPLGRWAPLASLGILLVLILGNVAIASVAT